MSRSINKRIAIGTFWMLLQRIVVRGIGLISMMILARILVPEDYGLIAMAASAYALLEMLAAFGFDVVLVKKDVLERDDYNSAWTARFIVYTALSLIFVSSAELISDFYDEERLPPIVYALGVSFFLSGIENIALVDFRRDMLFDREFKLQLYTKLSGFIVTIPLAFIIQSYWALVIGSVASKVVGVVVGYLLRPYFPRICFSRIREIVGFSKWLLFMNLAQFSRKQLPPVLLGKTVSSGAVGIWSISSQLSNDVSQALIASMNRPVYSGFSRIASCHETLKQSFIELSSIQVLFVLPLGFGISATSEFIIKVVLGEKWLNAIEPLSFMSIAVAVSSMASICQYIYLVKDKPQLTFTFALIGLSIFAPLTFYFSVEMALGLIGVVYAHFITCLVTPLLNYSMVTMQLKMSCKDLKNIFLRPMLSVFLMYSLLTYLFIPYLAGVSSNALVNLILCALIGAVVYFPCVGLIWLLQGRPRSAEAWLVEKVTKKIS